jgi:hypothetical protein
MEIVKLHLAGRNQKGLWMIDETDYFRLADAI